MKIRLFDRSSLFSNLVLVLTMLVLSACSNSTNSKASQRPEQKTIQTLNQQQSIEQGIVVAVKEIQIKQASNNPFGNIGVSAGSSGHRGLYGSVDLGTLTRIFSNKGQTKTAQEIIVQKQSGQTVAITQITKEIFKKGDNAKILIRNGKAQVIR